MTIRSFAHTFVAVAIILLPIALEANALARPLVRAHVHVKAASVAPRTAGAHADRRYTCTHNAYRSVACK